MFTRDARGTRTEHVRRIFGRTYEILRVSALKVPSNFPLLVTAGRREGSSTRACSTASNVLISMLVLEMPGLQTPVCAQLQSVVNAASALGIVFSGPRHSVPHERFIRRVPMQALRTRLHLIGLA